MIGEEILLENAVRTHPRIFWFVVVLVGLALLAGVTSIPPFDFDESFYRRIAEEMLTHKQFLLPTYHGVLDSNKPPTYAWLIVLSHALFENGKNVGTLAARFPAAFSTVVTLFVLMREMKQSPRMWMPLFAFGATLLPLLGSAAVLIDPVLTLAFTLALLPLSRVVREQRSMSRIEQVSFVFGVFFALALKGPIGIVLPGFSLVVHCAAMSLYQHKKLKSFFSALVKVTKYTARPFAFAAFLGVAFYGTLYASGGQKLVTEFIWVHNVHRTLSPMEGHRGPFYYHALVVLVLGSPLVPLILYRAAYRKLLGHKYFSSWSFEGSWIVGCVLFFSCIATKLPNYTWPVWPAFFLLASNGEPNSAPVTINRVQRVFARFVMLVACAVPFFLGVGLTGVTLGIRKLALLPLDWRARTALIAIDPLPFSVKGSLLVAGVVLVVFSMLLPGLAKRSWREGVVTASVACCLVVILLKLTVLPYASDVMTSSLQNLTDLAMQKGARALLVTDLQSPNVLHFFDGPVYQVSSVDFGVRQELLGPRFILSAIWEREACRSHGYEVVAERGIYVLCGEHLP